MDMTASIAPNSAQLNADDMIVGPMTVTIKDVTQGNAEQPVNVNLIETPGRPYKPSKSMRRVMVAAWGKEAAAYAGHRMTLYRNPDIKFGGQTVGGIEISHMTGIDKPMKVSLTATRGKKRVHTVQPLPTAPAQPDWNACLASVQGNPEAAQQLYAEAQAAGAPDTYLEAVKAAGTNGEQQ
jgi:hypothetical protein